MDKVLEKDIETKEEVKLILERLEEAKNGKVKTIDDKMIKVIDKKLLEVEQDDANGDKWLTREEADKLMNVNKELYV